MLAKTIIRSLRQPGTLYVETRLTFDGDPIEVQAKKSDVIAAYQEQCNGEDETGKKLVPVNGGLLLVDDHIGETAGQ